MPAKFKPDPRANKDVAEWDKKREVVKSKLPLCELIEDQGGFINYLMDKDQY